MDAVRKASPGPGLPSRHWRQLTVLKAIPAIPSIAPGAREPSSGSGGALCARALESRKQQSAEAERPGETAAQMAEDRGFEPRRAVKPNRISSAFTCMPVRRSPVRDRTETQARRTGKAHIVPRAAGIAGNPRPVRTRNGRAWTRDAGHREPSSAAREATSAMIFHPMPVRRWMSALLNPAVSSGRTLAASAAS